MKLKGIFKTVEDKAQKLSQVLEEFAKKDKLVPIKHIVGQYTMAIIARSAFSLNSECLGKEDDEFTHYSRKLLRTKRIKLLILHALFPLFPWIHKFLVQVMRAEMFDVISPDSDRYLDCVLKKSLDCRKDAERKGERLPDDLLQSFIAARNSGELNINNEIHPQKTISTVTTEQSSGQKVTSKTMSKDELFGQSLSVIMAGFETTSSALQMCFYLLAKHPDVQEKLYEEIKRVVQSESPTYEELSGLTYMEQVINETLRLFPPFATVSRVANETKSYGSITIPKGAIVSIPIFSIHKDPKHFPEPEKFDPERFNAENTAKLDSMAFLPFGRGPRICIGLRLAYLELKMALLFSLRKLHFEINERTEPKKDQDPEMENITILISKRPFQLSVRCRH